MGDRINFGFTTESGDNIFLYSHWGASSWIKDLQNALSKASRRFNDNSYATRITISQLVGNSWDSETGYGISVNSLGGSDVDFVPIVDFKYGFISIYELDYNDWTIGESLIKFDITKFIELDDLEIQALLNDVWIERYGQNEQNATVSRV